MPLGFPGGIVVSFGQIGKYIPYGIPSGGARRVRSRAHAPEGAVERRVFIRESGEPEMDWAADGTEC